MVSRAESYGLVGEENNG
eukprot:g31575.t1